MLESWRPLVGFGRGRYSGVVGRARETHKTLLLAGRCTP
jgi:hypothetical protein